MYPDESISKPKAAFIMAACFAVGILVSQMAGNAGAILDLTLSAYQNRYRVMTETDIGPEQYYLMVDDSTQLAALVGKDDRLVDLDDTLFSRLKALKALPNSEASINRVAALDEVSYMVKSDIPLFCH